MTNISIKIFCDSSKALRVIKYLFLHKKYRFLKDFIYKKTKKLENNKHHIIIR